MRRFAPLGTLLLALLWLPATVHCQLERLSGLEIFSCCSHQDSEHLPEHHQEDCHNDECASVESGLYKPRDTESLDRPASFFLVAVRFEPPHGDSLALPDHPADSPSTVPDTGPVWQFVQRAALHPRAPDLAS